MNKDKLDDITKKILAMSKYRNVQIPEETIGSLIKQALPLCKNTASLEKMLREKLHNIVALYLGDIDYEKAKEDFNLLQDNKLQDNSEELKKFSTTLLMSHASTEERGTDLTEMYKLLFQWAGKASSIADLACGLHPCGLPFMGLAEDTAYYAYDLNKARVDFLDIFIRGLGYEGGCFHQDILIQAPPLKFDLAFLFKEAHRLEKRQSGSLLYLLDSIKASKLVVSLPMQSLGSRQEFFPKYEKILCKYTKKNNWPLEILRYKNEIFYAIDRS